MRFFGKFITLCFSVFFTLTTLGLALLVTGYFYYSPQLPDSKDLQHIELQVPLRIYSRDERLIAEYGVKRRRPVALDQVPQRMQQAFIAIEDARYYEHQGIDFKGVARAAYSVIATGRASQGASTITMQLARNTFLDSRKTVERKLKETLLAFKLERTLKKEEILELYLNKIYLGNRAHGIAAAAETYYGKERLEDLTLAQMAMIAGLPKAPSRYNPIANPQRAMIRRDYILKRMLEQDYINRNEYESAVREPNTAKVHRPEIEANAPYLAEMVRSAIVKKYRDKAYTQGYHVYTTLDPDTQQHASDSLRKALIEYDRRHGYRGPEDQIDLDDYAGREEWLDKLATYPTVAGMQIALVIKADPKQAELLLLNEETINLDYKAVSWARAFITADRRGRKPRKVTDVIYPGDVVWVRQKPTEKTDQTQDTAHTAQEEAEWQLVQVPKVGGAVVILDPANGAIRAVMGGYDYYRSKFNRATQAMRQPGSSFKPFIYSAAMTRGFRPLSIVNDAPISVPGTNWSPKNYGGGYIGPTTLAEALAKSRNLVSIRLLRSTGISYTIDYAMRFGYQRKYLPPNLTLALGTGLTTPLQMASAYASFANGGFKINPHFIRRIEDNAGNLLFDASTEIKYACGDDRKTCTIDPTTDRLVTTATRADAQPPTATGGTDAAVQPAETTAQTQPQRIQVAAATRIMDSRTNTNIVKMMQNVTRFGTAARAGRVLKRKDIAGKTGTTNDQKDSWFCGFTPEYVTVAWAGFDDMAELGEGETSTKIAVPLWVDLMQKVLKDKPEKPWIVQGEKLQTVKIDADTGLVADADSANVVDEELTAAQTAQQPAPQFEFTNSQVATQTAQQQLQQQLQQQQQFEAEQNGQASPPPPRPVPPPASSEAVEIPEQIF